MSTGRETNGLKPVRGYEDGSDESSLRCLRHFSLFLSFFFFALESDEDVSDDESNDDGSASGFTSGSFLS